MKLYFVSLFTSDGDDIEIDVAATNEESAKDIIRSHYPASDIQSIEEI